MLLLTKTLPPPFVSSVLAGQSGLSNGPCYSASHWSLISLLAFFPPAFPHPLHRLPAFAAKSGISFSCPPESLAQQRDLPQSPPSPLVPVRRPSFPPLVRPNPARANARLRLDLIDRWKPKRQQIPLPLVEDRPRDSGLLYLHQQLPLLLLLYRIAVRGIVQQCHNQGEIWIFDIYMTYGILCLALQVMLTVFSN